MLWAQDVDTLVFPTILESLETYSYSCEGEDDSSDFVKHYSYAHSRASRGANPIPQSMVRRGSTGRGRLGPGTLAEPPDLPSYSEGERSTNTEVPMDDIDGASGSTSSVAPPVHNSRSGPRNCNINNIIDSKVRLGHGELQETTHGVRPSSPESLEVVTEVPPSHSTLRKLDKPTEKLEDPLATPKARRRSHSPLHHRQMSFDSTPQLPTINPFKEFFINPGLFTRKLRARSNSISSAASNASASGASVKSSGNTSDESGRGGKKFVPGGIVLARAGAAVGVSTGSTVEELEDAERRRQRRLRREIASS